MRAADNLELLLPDAPPALAERAQKLVTFLRLLSNDARHTPAASVRVSLDRARDELDAQARRRLLDATLDLARHHLYAVLGPESFVWLGECESTPQAAWSALEEHRDEWPWLCSVPEPGESALQVARRVLECAGRLGSTRDRQRLWNARLARAEHGPERGEAAFRELMPGASDACSEHGVTAAALAGVVECLLDRGAVARARTALDEGAELVLGDQRLRCLRMWIGVLQDDEPAAIPSHRALTDWRGRIPAPMSELRQHRAAWLPCLSGKTPPARDAGLASSAPAKAEIVLARVTSRREFGAALLAVFAVDGCGNPTLMHLDVAPGFRARVAEWTRERDAACCQASAPEHRLVVSASPIAVHRHGSQLRDTISPASVRALALAPVVDERGEVAGWMRIESEHHLLPTPARLAAAADTWRAAVLAQRREQHQRELASSAGHPQRAPDAIALELAPRLATHGPAPCAEVFRDLVAQLSMKTAQRHWWGLVLRDERAELVCEGGAALAEPLQRGAGRAIARAWMSAGVVRFDDPAPELALDASSASGLVLPLLSFGRLCGLLAIESNRRKDFPDGLAERWLERCRSFADDLRIALFREWHAERFGHDVHFSAASSAPSLEDVCAAGRSRAPVVLCGPAGSGKQTIARWLHFEGGREREPLCVFACGGDESELWGRGQAGDGSFARAGAGTLVLDVIERLSEASQLRLLACFDRAREHAEGGPRRTARPGLRLIATTRCNLIDCVRANQLRQDLGERLQRLHLDVAPLSRRRGDLPGLIALLTRRFSSEESSPSPSYSDEAIAMLWRQPWLGNVRQLENLIFKLVLLCSGREVVCADIERIAARFQLELVARLPSRHPDPDTLRAALATTANLRGTINKTRAALYLGWDPDTLVTRMTECGLLDGGAAATGATRPHEPGA
jgi:putative methionine-R-sulfoxide reductase with GAF domain